VFSSFQIGLSFLHRPARRTNKRKIGFVKFVKAILWFPFQTLSKLCRLIRRTYRDSGWREFAIVAPASLLIALIGYVLFCVFFRAEQIENKYSQQANIAVANQNFPLAKVYFQRMKANKELTPKQEFTWAMILSKTGNNHLANEVIERLAPDESAGLPAAHRIRAMTLAERIRTRSTTDLTVLDKLKWHLENAEDQSNALSETWTTFYLATKQFDEAIPHLLSAAKTNPQHYLVVAGIHQNRGHIELRDEAVNHAEKSYRVELANNPLSLPSRLALANVLVRQSKFDETESVLKEGFRLKPEKTIRRSLADFFVMRHDLSKRLEHDASLQVKHLFKAIEWDPHYGKAFERLMDLYSKSESSDTHATEIRQALFQLVAEGKSSAMAHMAVSNLLWRDGEFDKAEFHLEQAYELDPGMGHVINDLAWMVAHSKTPDLPRALKLVETAVVNTPENPRIRDTYGTILMKLERYQDAVTEFNKALHGSQDLKPIHKKLGVVYDKLGMEELAQIHLAKSKTE
jgi:tetratricopeptide (TPR) repeat protein